MEEINYSEKEENDNSSNDSNYNNYKEEESIDEFSNNFLSEMEKNENSEINNSDYFYNNYDKIKEDIKDSKYEDSNKFSNKYSTIKKNNEDFNISFSDFDDFFKNKNGFNGIETVAELFDYLEKIKERKIFKDSVIRFIFMEKDKSFFHSSYEIPFIKKDKNRIIFFDEKERGKCL